MHPLGRVIVHALDGRPPAADGGWTRVPPWRDGLGAIVAMTGHAFVAVGAEVDDERLTALGVDGVGGAHHPRVVCDLAGPHGWIDVLDALLAIRAPGGTTHLVPRPDLADHPRARFARTVRESVIVLGPADTASASLVTLARGVGGLWEVGIEVDPLERGRGQAVHLLAGALAAVPRGEVVVAAVAPGNVASDRVFRICGLRLVGSVQLFRPAL